MQKHPIQQINFGTTAIPLLLESFLLSNRVQSSRKNLIKDGGKKALPPVFPPVTSPNLEMIPQNFIRFYFNPFSILF